MKLETVFDVELKQDVLVDTDRKQLYTYDNDKQVITYSAPQVDKHGLYQSYWVMYQVQGRIDDIAQRLEVWNNKVKFGYSLAVECRASQNDPERKLWQKYVEYVEKHSRRFFTKAGNWKKRYRFNKDDIKTIAQGVE